MKNFWGGEDYENLLKKGTTVEENEELIPINERIEYHTFSFTGKIKMQIYNDARKFRFTVFRFNEIGQKQKKVLTTMLTNLLK